MRKSKTTEEIDESKTKKTSAKASDKKTTTKTAAKTVAKKSSRAKKTVEAEPAFETAFEPAFETESETGHKTVKEDFSSLKDKFLMYKELIMSKKFFKGISFTSLEETFQQNIPAFLIYTVVLFLLMGITCFGIFFYANKGYEEVMVPNVTGKNLTRALLEMQEKELYPKLQLRYSNLPGEAGQVISQSPKEGTIVKAGRRITLVVSRGVMIDHVGNYIGSNIDMVKNSLDALYGGTDMPLLYIGHPVFRMDSSPAGTILEQNPEEGTPISTPVELQFVVSSGPAKPLAKVPELEGKTIAEVIAEMSKTKLIFDFISHTASESEAAGTVVSQQKFDSEELPEYSHVLLDIALPSMNIALSGDTIVAANISGRTEDEVAGEASRDESNFTHGIFAAKVEQYPFAVPFKLDAIPQDGGSYTVATFNHIGGDITVPYSVPRGTVLVLSAINAEKGRITVQ